MKPLEEQLELLRRGLADELPHGSLEVRLKESLRTGRPLRVKLGVDPTASRVHLGWAVVLRKLRQFQECGHTAVLILGTFTARVGDPTGKSETRKRLTASQVDDYARSCTGALRRILLPEPLELPQNDAWLAPMTMEDVLDLTSRVTVAQMLERDDFAKRFEAGRPISLIEFLYPLLQAKDSVEVEADIELGGTDQTFNNLMGRTLQRATGQDGQLVLTLPLLVGTDGTQKMSQSLGNGIFIDDDPNDMFGKVMSVPDTLTVDYARLAAWWPTPEVDALQARLVGGSVHPNVAKRQVARSIVDLYHGGGAGMKAERAFDAQFKRHEVPGDILTHYVRNEACTVTDLLQDAFDTSRSEARRLVAQGGVKLGGKVQDDPEREYGPEELDDEVLQVGRRRFVRLHRMLDS